VFGNDVVSTFDCVVAQLSDKRGDKTYLLMIVKHFSADSGRDINEKSKH
jgi:hypothetical protein